MASNVTPNTAAAVSARDFAEHSTTYAGFLSLVRWTIVGLFLVVIALYCFIEGQQPILGTLLLLVLPVGAVAVFITRSRTSD
jgi:hypothetical protein